MPLDLVLGSQWGDEGKGRITDSLARQAKIVARFSGGDNAGHTVTVAERRYQLHLIPSGIIHEHSLCVMGSGMVVNPTTLIAEIKELQAAGVDINPGRLLISPSAHMITPGHLALDAAEEGARGSARLGTTKRGIGPSYTHKAARQGLRLEALLSVQENIPRFRQHLEASNRMLERIYEQDGLDIQHAIETLQSQAEFLAPYLADTGQVLDQALRQGQRVVGEGAQGTLLDLDHGTYPYVTSSHPTTAGALLGLGIGPQYLDRIIGVTKAFQTRVGAGPFPTELHDELAERLRGSGANPWDEFGTTTGRPRRCGWLDLVLLRYAHRINGFTELAITKLDILSGLPLLMLCVAYKRNGSEWEDLSDGLSSLESCEPVMEEQSAWAEGISRAREWRDLPLPARDYLETIESAANVPIKMVSVGPERDQLLYR